MISRVRLFAVLSVLVVLSLTAACSREAAPSQSPAAQQPSAAPPTIVFMTDFGTANDAVAICRAVIFSIAPT
ncbi:MAG TPA: hypothetical protein VH140_09975, partial [Candidatus Acidoferrum sp.]|nr:hypothetical protein [Candidatus Acidoferrum sp.]